MNQRIRKLGQDGARLMLAAIGGIGATAFVFLAGMFTEDHLVTQALRADVERSVVHHIANGDLAFKVAR